MPEQTRYAGWLPPIGAGGRTGWLAFKAESVAAISGAISLEQSASNRIRDSLCRAFAADPALLLFTVVSLRESGGGPAGATITLAELADWWCQFGRSVWRRTDWLAAPAGSAAEMQLARFAQLDDYFRLLPPPRWLAEADVWFAAAGAPHSIADAVRLDWSSEGLPMGSIASFPDAHLTISSWIRDQDNRDVFAATFKDAVEASKRELAHTLAYGLSHEINNPLANISTRAQTLRTRVPAPLIDSVQRIVDQTFRAHAMIADLMFYANPPATEPGEFDLCSRIELVAESLAETAARLGIEIHLADVASGEPVIVTADAELIGEAVAALVRNSIEAIGTDGHIQIDVKRDESQVRIAVADSGPGISADAARMATSPYYSGREAGRGLGLGLCRAERIAGLHGGSLQLTPALAGCVATILLPLR